MRVARIRLDRFRGFDHADLVLPEDVVFAGEPRAGRTDLIEALRRVLDPRSTRSRVNPLDIHRSESKELPTEVEVTLLNLGEDLEELLDDYLEPFNDETVEPATTDIADKAVLGVRLCYRAWYDFDVDAGEHWVDFPALSHPSSNYFRRASRVEREALPALFIDGSPALQLRAQGAFRTLISENNADDLADALSKLEEEIHYATSGFSAATVVGQTTESVLESGPQDLFAIGDKTAVDFMPEDGSLAALLRALQPAVTLDHAGPLPLQSHGSSLQNVLSAAEAITAGRGTESGLVIIGDDFGDGMDASSSEHMAALVHATASQAILATRRPEVVRAFDPSELIRLTRSHGVRKQHKLPNDTNKSSRVTRRLVLEQLLAALSARTVALVEGPLDVEGYGPLAARLFKTSTRREHSLAANGIRLVAPPGSDGGVSRLPGVAEIALQLGFHVRAIVDNDKPGQEDPAAKQLEQMVEQLIVLPPRTAVEAALVRGLSGKAVRQAAETLYSLGLPQIPNGLADDDLADHLIKNKLLKKQGLITAWVYALSKQPPIGRDVIEELCGDTLGRVEIDGKP